MSKEESADLVQENRKKWRLRKKKIIENDLNELKKEVKMDEHVIDIPKLLERLSTNSKTGLADFERQIRLKYYGPNRLTPPKKTPEIVKFLKELVSFFAILLWIGAALSIIGFLIDPARDFSNLYIGLVLVFVIVVSGAFSYFQNRTSSNVMKKFQNFLPTFAFVLVDGKVNKVETSELVPGDIVLIEAGNKIPADVRIIECDNLKVDNSSLTGESEPQPRSVDCTHENPMETKNLAFYGTLATEGSAKGVVIATGDNTVIGRIAGLTASTSAENTPMYKDLNRFIFIISAIAIGLGLLFFGISLGVNRGQNVISNIVFMIGIVVANVPEGLLVTVTAALTLTARRMAKKNVLVKRLECVETLGSTTCICSDKTGTLTQNVMTCSHLWYDNKIYNCPTTTSEKDYDESSETFEALKRIAILCNRANFAPEDMDKPLSERRVIGDATESALVRFWETVTPINEFRETYPEVFVIKFNSTNKWAVSINRLEGRDQFILLMKGAPERVIERCSTILINGEEKVLSNKWKRRFQRAYDRLGNVGERVLGFAQLVLDKEDFPIDYHFAETQPDQYNFPLHNLCFVGLISLIDPPKATVPEAVRLCKSAGIKVIMVTGDHPLTAKAIAKAVGIITSENVDELGELTNSLETAPKERLDAKELIRGDLKPRANAIVVHGSQLKHFTQEDWDRVLDYEEIVFARTSPQQKLVIVENNQRRGHVVAVTGDGVNDSPALKKADIGIAMGISGSDVSKDAADMILLDDNFASIVKGIEEGRLIFDNLKKSIAYTLTSNIPELAPFLCFALFGLPLPLTTVLILCIDIGTDLVPAIALAYEAPERDLMKRPPRNIKTEALVNANLIAFSYLQIGVMQALAGFFTYFCVLGYYGFAPSLLLDTGFDWGATNMLLLNAGYILRQEALARAQSAFFVTIVVVQWAGLVVCKTRRLSLIHQGMWHNKVLLLGLVIGTALACIIVYVPPLNIALGTRPFLFIHWLPAIPYAILIYVYDEVRKGIIRKFPNGFVARYAFW
jgi:sodium/potassium-transporting ATPase subunit alpha